MAKPISTFEQRRNRVRRHLLRHNKGRPRLSVFRSSKHIYVQVIDDTDGRTVAAASTVDKSLRDKVKKGDPLMVIEAMKMEHTIAAPSDGVVEEVRFALDEQVEEGVDLVSFSAAG